MNPRASELIDLLDLKPHPEGGFFREIFRSTHSVQSSNSRKERSALTEIYFLLTAGDCSRWHQVDQDEAFHYYEGAALELFWIEEGNKKYCRQIVGEIGGGRQAGCDSAGWLLAGRANIRRIHAGRVYRSARV
jgi:hypothetical protein